MFDLPQVFKEVTVESTQSDKWRELVFSTGGTTSTLQDIKVVPHSGGYSFTDPPNRFIYWRTNYDVLEIIEQSLDTNLCGNQVRYKFPDAPILDGISIHEYGGIVFMLVPTVSSVHRLTFLHPSFKSSDYQFASVFSDVSVDNLCNTTTFHLFSTAPNLPHTAASTLADDEDAVFCFALNNNSILLIRLQLTGVASTHYLKQDSSGRGFLSVFLGGKSNEDNNTISMVLQKQKNNTYLFALNRNNQLRIWCCNKLQCIGEYDLTPPERQNSLGQNHVLRKVSKGKTLTLVAYLSFPERSQLIVLTPRMTEHSVTIDSEPNIFSVPEHMDLIEMNVSCDSQVVWCLWRSVENGDTVISGLSVRTGVWSTCVKDNKTSALDDSPRFGLTSREYFLNLIFAPGVFSTADVAKVLSIYKGNPQLELSSNKSELRTKVCLAVEMEIQAEALEYELSDEDYVDISERCWNKFYMNCVQYQETGKVPNNLFWLPSVSILVVTSKTNISFYRTVEVLEEALMLVNQAGESQSYKHLMKIIGSMDVTEEQKARFTQALKGFSPVIETLVEIASEFKLEDKLNREVVTLMKYQDLQLTLRTLSDILFMPETFEHTGDYCASFRGELGAKIIFTTIQQIIRTRLEACYNLALLLGILDNSELKRDFLAETLNLCSAYWVLNWCCETVLTNHPQLSALMQQLLVKPEISMQPMLLDTVWSILQYLWPLTNNSNLAEYLLLNKQHHLLKSYSRMTNHDHWKFLLVRSYLETNEPHKAADLVQRMADTPDVYLKMIKLFEHAEQPDIIVELAKGAIDVVDKSDHPDVPTLYSILFLNQLKLGHYDSAFVSLNKNPDRSRRVDCLRELVITLMNANRVDTLLKIPYNDLLPELEDIMEQRARSIQPQKATFYYNFLYALHIKYENYKKAARIMFEQGFRADDNKIQVSSYGMCLNCLSLVSVENAWILKPNMQVDDPMNEDDEDCMEIYELADIEREYELSMARAKLPNCPPDTSAQEVVMKLIFAGRYRAALKLSSMYKLGLEPAFEALASACTRVPEDPDPWTWLADNDVSDFVIGDENAMVVAYRLLEALLNAYEESRLTRLHKVVAAKIISMEFVLPYWLESSYKIRSAPELLRLYLMYGNLNEAAKLLTEYIAALLGNSKEMFGLRYSLGVTSPPLYFPVNAVDTLLHELEFHQMTDLYEEVKNSVDSYLKEVEKISQDKIRYDRERKAERDREIIAKREREKNAKKMKVATEKMEVATETMEVATETMEVATEKIEVAAEKMEVAVE